MDATGPQGTLKVALKYDSMTKQPVIRGLKRISRPGLRTYKNHNEFDVQVSLFYGNEILNNYDYHKKVPYFSTIIEAGRKYELPIDKKSEIYLYTFDKNGKRIRKMYPYKQIIKRL